MPNMRLTDAAVRRITPPTDKVQVDYWDSLLPAFGLRVSRGGTKSWQVSTRVLSRGEWVKKRIGLGRYPDVSLEKARTMAREALTRASKGDGGQDVMGVRRERREAQRAESRNTFANVRGEFLRKYRTRQKRKPSPRTLAELQRVLSSPPFSAWDDKPIKTIGKKDVMDALDVLLEQGKETAANRYLTYLSMLFAWALDRDIIEVDPTDRVKKPGTESSRARVLSPAELRAIWKGTDPTQQNKGDLFACIVRVLMLTGQRRNEVAGMTWGEFDFDGKLWTLPADRTKNHREHLVPVSDAVVEILREREAEQKAMGMDTPLVFTSTGSSPFSGWSRSKARLDHRASIASWTLHDLRRTLVTRLSEDLKQPPHIVEAVVNHVSGTRAGVAGVYNRALYLDERRRALDAWGRYVTHLVGDADTDNVVELVR